MTAKLKDYYPALVDEVVPKPISFQLLTEVLQRLADERVSIRDLKNIFQSLAEVGRTINDPLDLVEHVRAGLKRRICYQLSEGKPTLFVYQLDPDVEELFRNSIRHTAMGPKIEMESAMIRSDRLRHTRADRRPAAHRAEARNPDGPRNSPLREEAARLRFRRPFGAQL